MEKLSIADKQELLTTARRYAWLKASHIEPLSDQELARMASIKQKYGSVKESAVRQELVKPKHWESLRWFLFGGAVPLPVGSNPSRAVDPKTNPAVTIRQPGFVYTMDEHDETTPFKLLPDKKFLRLLAYAWVHEPILFVPKSRQLMVTWLFCSIACHETVFRQARRTAYISKKFDDAHAHLEQRIKLIWEQLPHGEFYIPNMKHDRSNGVLHVPDTSSFVQAIGEESGKGLRQFTFSWVFSDEVAFQSEPSEGYAAALPALKSGSGQSRFTGVSTPNGKEFFWEMVSGQDTIPTPSGQ